MRSNTIKKGFDKAPHRALLRATGLQDEDFNKPFVAIVNSYVDVVPGHVHLQDFGKLVKEAVRAAGAVPFEFNTIGVDDGIAMGHMGMKYSLPSRELIADCVETMIEAHRFDAMVCIPNCDKIVPGMLMGALFKNDQQAGGIGVVLGIGLAALGGAMIPLAIMRIFSPVLYQVAHITPHAWGIEAYEELILYDGTIVDIVPQLAVLTGFAAVVFLLGTVALRRSLTR